MEEEQKTHDFQWIRDMSIEDYDYLTKLEDSKIIDIINKIVCREIKKYKN